jgi:hypothetical protein
MQHPGVIDELAGDALLAERFVAADFERELDPAPGRAAAPPARTTTKPCSTCCAAPTMPKPFRTLARDVEHRITVEQVADDLSRWPTACCASCTLVLEPPEATATAKHRNSPSLATASWAARSWATAATWTSSFVFDDDDERAPEVYAAFVRKLINWLTVRPARAICSKSTPRCAPTATPACWSPVSSLRQLPAATRQQHRLDLGTPGHDAGALCAPGSAPCRRALTRCARP